MKEYITSTTILAGFFVVACFRYFVGPYLREWPGDRPEAAKLRHLDSAAHFWFLFRQVVAAWRAGLGMTRQYRTPEVLAEKLMLAVCGVNECHRGAYLHAQAAMERGVCEDEVEATLAGQFADDDEAALTALRYARHFAETAGDVSDDMRDAFESAFPPDTVRHMDALLVATDFGNLCSNTVFYFERARISGEDRHAIYGAYLLARPVDSLVRRRAILYARKRAAREGA